MHHRTRWSVAVAAVIVAGAVMGGASRATAGGDGQPWLGVALAPGHVGVRVTRVVPDTAADAAGVAEGDEIVAVAGAAVRTPAELMTAVRAARTGDEVVLGLVRGGTRIDRVAVLAARPDYRTIVRRVLLNARAPRFDLPVVSGAGSGRLDAYAGKVVMIELFSVSCHYCSLTHAALARARARHRRGDLVILAISSDTRASLEAYLAPRPPPPHALPGRISRLHHGPLPFVVLHDVTGSVRADYWSDVYPTVIVIDRDGYIRHIGFGAGQATTEAIAAAERLLGGRP